MLLYTHHYNVIMQHSLYALLQFNRLKCNGYFHMHIHKQTNLQVYQKCLHKHRYERSPIMETY